MVSGMANLAPFDLQIGLAMNLVQIYSSLSFTLGRDKIRIEIRKINGSDAIWALRDYIW